MAAYDKCICLGAVFVAIAVRAAACVHVAVVVDDGVVLALLRPLQIILLDALAERVVVRRALGEEEAEVAQSEHLKF